ncbi:MAG: hypothetical protein Q8760_02405, partial [Candidatus Phytoplasma australasiaticum]|nr:hypothetical protein [Candidatus Phytoplasma australasiaticum]
REKEEIAKIKKSWQSSLDLLKDDKITINEKQKECDQYQSQLNLISPQITSFEKQKLVLEKKLEIKQSEVETKQKEQKQFKYFLPNLTEELRTSKQKYNSLQVEIDKINKEKSEIVSEIGKIKVKIGKLEASKRKYQNMLTRAENYKKNLEERYEIGEKQHKNLIISELNSLYEISSAEG